MKRLSVPASVAALLALAGCAGDPSRLGDTGVRPADLVECRVGSSTEGLPADQVESMQHERCHPQQNLRWSPGKRDTIKPDFRRGGNG